MNLIIPSLEEQKRIMSIIKPIDDKIHCNNIINDNLQQQAQARSRSNPNLQFLCLG